MIIRRRRPWRAFWLSFFLPGLGQLYAGALGAAIAALACALVTPPLVVGSFVLAGVGPIAALLVLLLSVLLLLLIPLHAASIARRRPAVYRLRPYNRWYVYAGVYLLVGFVIVPFELQAVMEHVSRQPRQIFRVPTPAMAPTLLAGDFLSPERCCGTIQDVERGEVLVYRTVRDPGFKTVKRVEGLPGDTLVMQDGILIRNRVPVVEPAVPVPQLKSESARMRAQMRAWQVHYLTSRDTSRYAPDLLDWGPIVVPPDSVFALGDAREASYDSRYYGFVPLDHVIGRAGQIYFSYDAEGTGPIWTRIRLDRIGLVVE